MIVQDVKFTFTTRSGTSIDYVEYKIQLCDESDNSVTKNLWDTIPIDQLDMTKSPSEISAQILSILGL